MSWTDYDMHQAWEAGAQWVADRVEIDDGELFVPTDDPGIEGRDWADECGHWLNDYEQERGELYGHVVAARLGPLLAHEIDRPDIRPAYIRRRGSVDRDADRDLIGYVDGSHARRRRWWQR